MSELLDIHNYIIAKLKIANKKKNYTFMYCILTSPTTRFIYLSILLAIVCSNAVRLSLKACECLRDRHSKSNAFIALFFLLLKYVRLFFIFCNSSSFIKINANSTQKRQNNKLLRKHFVCSIYV